MTNIEKYDLIFMEVFSVGKEVLNRDFEKTNVDKWDSVRQLNLISSIEEAFDIMLDTEELLGLSSYDIGREILSKYGITFD